MIQDVDDNLNFDKTIGHSTPPWYLEVLNWQLTWHGKMIMTRKRHFHYFLNQKKYFKISNLIKEGLKSGPALKVELFECNNNFLCVQNHCVTWWFRPETHALWASQLITFHNTDPVANHHFHRCYEHDVMNTAGGSSLGIYDPLMRFHSSFGNIHHWISLLFRLDYWNTSCYNASVWPRQRRLGVCDCRRFQLGTSLQRRECPIKKTFFGRQAFLWRYVYFSTFKLY